LPNENARGLRKRLTPQEVKLWVKLRELKELGFRFRRQAPIGRYIVDFASFGSRVVIEVMAANTALSKALSWIDSATLSFDQRDSMFCGFGIRTSIRT
jgi:hypothetical protein